MLTDQEMTPAETLYRIEQVAARTGLTKRTLRYYEEIGLLDPPPRTEGNYRLYTEADITRLERIMKLKDALGLSLAEIRTMIATEEERDHIRAAYRQDSDPARKLEQLDQAEALTHQQLALVAAKLSALQRLEGELRERLERYALSRAEIQAMK